MPSSPVAQAWIFARGGSKGLPRKNILPLGGRPLIAHAIEVGQASRHIDQVFVSTDCPEIAETAAELGAVVPFLRPERLAADTAAERDAWRHAIEWARGVGGVPMDVLVSLSPTSPLRTAAQVDRAIERYLEGPWDTVISVARSDRHPSFNMVKMSGEGEVELLAPPTQGGARRQDYDPVYDIGTAFYVTSPDFVMRTDAYWQGRVGAVEIPEECAVDIDSQLDFDFAEFLLSRRGEAQ